MSRTASFLLAMLLLALPAPSQLGAPLGKDGPRPPDLNWPQNQLPGEPPPPPMQKQAASDIAKLQRDARELAEISSSIPTDVDRVRKGLLPKDVIEKLKRVEKLSRQLRGELTR